MNTENWTTHQVIGQEAVEKHLLSMISQNKLPHALLFCGPQGSGKLPMALGLARLLLCQNPAGGAPCGQCNACLMTARWAHPDLHFTFPIVKYKDAARSVSDAYIEAWRARLSRGPYFDMADWLADMKADDMQAVIYTAESDALQRKLSLKAAMGGKKVVVIWMPERMNDECANKLLKLVEEPPAETHILLVSEDPGRILPTIRSRAQRIDFRPLAAGATESALTQQEQCPPDQARYIARIASGNYTEALKMLHAGGDRTLYFDLFVLLMRLAYQRNIREMRRWSEQLAGMGRERQKEFLMSSQRLIRENFIFNFGLEKLNRLTTEEANFAQKFARFVNERNVIGIMEELGTAQRDIEQNVNPRFVFFDFALKMIVLLIR